MRTKNRRVEMGIWSLIVVLLISSTASLKKKCPSNILKKFLSDPSKAKEHYDNGETIDVTCLADSGDDGYDYSNNDGSEGLDTKNIRVLKCTDGKWIGDYPGCFSNCSKPDIYAILNPEYDVYAPGDNVTVTACKKDNAGIEGDTTLICMADGTWIGSARCPKQHKSCNEQPPTISNAYRTDVVLDEYKHGTVLQYKCSQAFDQMGKYSVRCHDGRWIPDSASLIRCIIGHCSHIYSRDIGNMRVKNISGQVGTYAEFECYDGYELDGSAKILCMADRKWHPEIPKCKPISCPPPKQILHGHLIQETNNGLLNIYQSTIRYDCDKGYRIVGPRFRKCQSDRTWSGNDTKCEEIVCENPSRPENGNVYLTDKSQKVGSQIEYICDEHHIMEPITSQFAICTVHGNWSSPQPRCIKICKVRSLLHGSIRTISGLQRKITEDSYVHENTELHFTCNDGYERYASGYETQGRLTCVDIALLPGSPECRPRRCLIAPPVRLEYLIEGNKVLHKYVDNGTVMKARCPDWMELVGSSSYLDSEQVSVKCNLGKLEPESLFCQDKRCNIVTRIENGHFRNRRNVIVTGEKIISGSNIKLICSEGYELYNRTNSMYLELEQTDIKCYQGSFTPEIPSCKPRRCLIAPPVRLEYLIEGNKVLHKHVDNGTVMQARCPDWMELVGSSSYLDSEQVSVKCNLGKLEPESLFCQDKRCNIVTRIENGHFRNRGKVIVTGEKIISGSNIKLICSEGYELYNRTNSMYLELEQTDIKCYQGSFTPEIPSCKPRRCLIAPPVRLEYLIEGNKVLHKHVDNGTVMQARCPDWMELVGSSSYLDSEQVSVKCNLGKLEPESLFCQDKRCNIVTRIENGHFRNRSNVIVTGEKIISGSNIKLICSEGYELYNRTNSMYLELEQTDIKCYQGSFTPEIPSCKPRRCLIAPPVRLEYLIEGNKVLHKYVDNGTVMQARCPDWMELFRSSSYLDSEQVSVKCNLGKLEPESLFCQDKRCNIVTRIENGHFRNRSNVIVTGEKIISGSNIKLICSEGYELYNRTNSMYLELEQTDIKCYQGSFTPEIPSCKPRRCLIEPPVHMEYLIEGNKVLHKYVDNGTVMQARCPDWMELVGSSSYLDSEQYLVECKLGTLEPRTLDCKGKSCKPPVLTEAITEFVAKGTKSTPENYFPHDQSVEAVCKDGYRQHGAFTCQGGIWTGNSTCEPEVCNGPEFQFIVVNNGTLVNEGIIFSHGAKLNASCNSSYTLHADEGSGGNGALTECIHGEWKPKVSCKQMCKTIDVGREISGFIVSETKTRAGEFVPHNQSIETVCGEGYRPHGILTCNSGIWMGNSTCELDVKGCVLKDPGMHFISLGDRTVLNVGENANVSCKLGYQIVPNISATRGYEYDYGDSESTADPSEMPETEDNKNLIAVSDGNYTCRDSGKWEPELRFSCKQMCKTIDVAREISGFIVSETKTTPGEFVPHNQSIETVCGEGYRPHGILTCNAGIWMGNSTCEPDVTGCVLKDPGMHFISLGNRTMLQVGENANVSCKFGYQIVRNTSAKHLYEYDYIDYESTAHPFEMPETEDNENLIAVSDGNYTCRDNGKWEPEIRFSCKQIMCDSFYGYNLENGNIIYSTHQVDTVGTVVSFQCNPGYTRHGPETRTCQIDGTWSGQCVTCQRDRRNASITCPAPCVPEGARKTGSHTYEIGSIVEFYCTRSKTQDRDDRRNIRHCIKNGKYASWNGTKINCKEIICDKGDHYGFENGKVKYSSSIATVGTEASFMCNPGYNLHGPMTRICQKDGTWSAECVTCQKHQPNSSTCPAPCVPDGAIKIGSLSYEIGSRIQLYCLQSNMNYTEENSYIRHCVNDGKSASWNGTNINCKAKCEPLTDQYNVVQNGVVPGILSDKTVVVLNCNRSIIPVQAECRKGRWNPKKPTCKYTCPLSAVNGTLYNYKVAKDQVLHGPIESGRQIKVTCEDGFFPKTYNYDVSKCVNGVWTPEIVKCEKRDTCPLSAVNGTLYNYKVTKDQVFNGPIESGRQIKVTCEDGFFPNTHNYDVSKCVNGVWTPEIVKCEKRGNF